MLSGAFAVPMAMAVKGFADFDDQMRLVRAVTKATKQEFESLTQVAAKLGRETSFTAKQVADGMVSLGRMGFSPKEIEQAIQPTLDLARATGTDLGEAANIAANSMRIFGIEASRMSDVADILTATANGSAQTLTDLFEALKMAGPQAKAAGENITDTSAALGVLANLGIKGSLAGTALRKSFSQFAKTKVQDKLKAVGISTVDANGNLRKMAEIIADIGRVMATMPSAEKLAFAEDIFDIRGSLAGLSLGGNVKELDAFIERLYDVKGTARTNAQEMDDGLGGSFRKLLSAVEGAMNAIGKALEGTLKPFIDKITATTLAVIKWIEANSGLVTAFAATIAGTAALGAALIVIGVAAKGAAAGFAVIQTAIKGFTFLQGVCIAQGVALRNSISLIGAAFVNFRNTAIPALVGTEQLCAAFGLASTAANRTAASIVLMSNAEAAATAKSILAAKWTAMTGALKAFRTSAIAATIATKAQAAAEAAMAAKGAIVAGWVAMTNALKGMTLATAAATVTTYAHTAAEAICTAGTIALNKARQIAIATTALFTAANLKAVVSISAVTVGNFLLAAAAKVAAVAMMALSAVMTLIAAHPVAAALIALGVILAGVCIYLYRAANYTAKLSDEAGKLREKNDELRKTDQLRMERLKQLSEKQKLTNAEMAEARQLAKELRSRYGDLGITISDNTVRIKELDSAAKRLGAVQLRVENVRELGGRIYLQLVGLRSGNVLAFEQVARHILHDEFFLHINAQIFQPADHILFLLEYGYLSFGILLVDRNTHVNFIGRHFHFGPAVHFEVRLIYKILLLGEQGCRQQKRGSGNHQFFHNSIGINWSFLIRCIPKRKRCDGHLLFRSRLHLPLGHLFCDQFRCHNRRITVLRHQHAVAMRSGENRIDKNTFKSTLIRVSISLCKNPVRNVVKRQSHPVLRPVERSDQRQRRIGIHHIPQFHANRSRFENVIRGNGSVRMLHLHIIMVRSIDNSRLTCF